MAARDATRCPPEQTDAGIGTRQPAMRDMCHARSWPAFLRHGPRVRIGARAAGAVPTVITFDPHPRAVLHPASAPPLLQTFDQKIEALGVLGIEQTIVLRFTPEFASVRAHEFLSDVVVDRLHAREVYLGKGFAFGHDREGNIDLLRRLGG